MLIKLDDITKTKIKFTDESNTSVNVLEPTNKFIFTYNSKKIKIAKPTMAPTVDAQTVCQIKAEPMGARLPIFRN
jgi:hypothetical protein